MRKKDFIMMELKNERDYAERQARQEIGVLRGILDRLEARIDEGNVTGDDGLQGNEWRLQKQIAHLEKANKFIKNLEDMED